MLELGLTLGRRSDLDVWFVLNRDLPTPTATVERLLPYGRLAYSSDSDLPEDAIYHVPSPFEPSPIDRIWPPKLRSQPLVVTLHDLIPAVFPDEVMPDPAVRRAYWARAEMIRQADRILSVSHATAHDVVRLLGVRPELISVTGGGVSDEFTPPANRAEARAALQARRQEIDAEFVLYTGGMDYRKNVGALLRAYAALPPGLRDRYKLVLVGRLGRDDPRGSFAEQAEALGIPDRAVFTGHVSDEELVLLYQGTSLFVFPSLYEGFGLPVVEALACGAPAIVGRNSSLLELAEPEEAFFDPADPSSIEAALAQALQDEQLLERLRQPAIRERFNWRRITELTVDAYAETIPRPRPTRAGKRILCVAPLPAEGADGETTRRVLEALADRCEVDLLVDDRDGLEPPAGIGVLSVDGLARIERLRGYDGTVFWLGNAPEYAFALEVLRSRPGIVIAYNVCLRRLYADRDSSTDGPVDALSPYLAREAIRHSATFFVHLSSALSLARVEAGSGDETKIEYLPPPLPRIEGAEAACSHKPIAVFAGESGLPERLVTQLRELEADLTIVGDSRFLVSDHSAAITVRGAEHEPGFVTFHAQCRAAGLPTLLYGISLGDRPGPNQIELKPETTDAELRAALEGLKRKPDPIGAAAADASLQEVADRLLQEVDALSKVGAG